MRSPSTVGSTIVPDHLAHERLVGERDRRHGAHAARIGSGISLAYALIVLGYGQYTIALAVRRDENGTLDTRKVFLDHDRIAGMAETADSISPSSLFASSSEGTISTPLPAARPSAFST